MFAVIVFLMLDWMIIFTNVFEETEIMSEISKILSDFTLLFDLLYFLKRWYLYGDFYHRHEKVKLAVYSNVYYIKTL